MIIIVTGASHTGKTVLAIPVSVQRGWNHEEGRKV